MMKPIKVALLLAIFVLAGTLTVTGQSYMKHPKSINLQLSAGNYLNIVDANYGIGLNFDSRFKKNSPWGYRVGVKVAYSREIFFFLADKDYTWTYSIPFEVNYLVGKHKSCLELGLGMSLNLCNDHLMINEDEQGASSHMEIKNKFDPSALLTLGYRYTAMNGFQFRIGITGTSRLTGVRNYAKRFALLPYLGFGKAF